MLTLPLKTDVYSIFFSLSLRVYILGKRHENLVSICGTNVNFSRRIHTATCPEAAPHLTCIYAEKPSSH